ncbi:MAG: AAA family ATPase, partial [Gammaproteobacteria bacterium]|nr:AAA family ATPase [Gammaproteobacteria bacterium]
MLIRFSIENWMSFRDSVTFSMIASPERQHREHLIKQNKYETNILPIAAVFGGNASGKTNLFKAIAFVRDLIVNGTKPDIAIQRKYFLLDDTYEKKPSRFSLELCIDEKMYEYTFSVTQKIVQEEKLIEIGRDNEQTLFKRQSNKIDLTQEFIDAFEKTEDKKNFLRFVAQGTRDNQLFLTNAVSQNVTSLKPIYDWFKNNLILIAPDTRFGAFEKLFGTEINNKLAQLDTGISRLGEKRVPLETLPSELIQKLNENLKEGETVRIFGEPFNEKFLVTRQKGKLIVKKLVTIHQKVDGTEIEFEMPQESDGSQRLIDVLPAFIDLFSSKSKNVYLFDEIDRCLHPILIRQLLEQFLDSRASASQTQLLFTTHNLSLMEQQLLRRDEIWITERDNLGATYLNSFSKYKIRYDKNLQKLYLQG